MSGNVWNRHQEVLWSMWGSNKTLWISPTPNVTWHSRTWLSQRHPPLIRHFTISWLDVITQFREVSIEDLQRMRLANRGRRTSGPVPFGICICSYVETIQSWNCHVYGNFAFRTSVVKNWMFYVDWEGLSTSLSPIWQTWRYQITKYQSFRFWVAMFNLRPPIVFYFLSVYDMSWHGPVMNV